MLEVLARRHYREYDLHDLRSIEGDGRPRVAADYTLDGRPTHLVSTIGTYAELADPHGSLASAISAARDRPGRRPRRGRRPLPALARGARGRRRRQSCAGPARGGAALRPGRTTGRRRRLRRRRASGGLLRVPSRWRRTASSRTPSPRGVHPMVGRRLNLWRLREFDITRLEAPEDVLLYECVAPGEPGRPAAGGAGAGAPAGRRPRRERPGDRPAARRARDGELPGGDPARARRSRCRGQRARHEPRLGAHLARRRDRRRRS